MIIHNWSLPNVLHTRYLGVVTGQELVQATLASTGDERFDDLDLIIGDWSLVRKTLIDHHDVRYLSACLEQATKNHKTIANPTIIRRSDTGIGLATLYRHYGRNLPWEIAIFYTLDEVIAAYQLDEAALHESVQVIAGDYDLSYKDDEQPPVCPL